MEDFKASVITISDKGSRGERVDTSGPALKKILIENNYEVIYENIISDDIEGIKKELIKCVDELKVDLILTTGGTGFSIRDNTPEATMSIIEKQIPGIPELMRYESMKITNRACLSRAVCGIRKRTLILNLPGSEKAAKENFMSVIEPIKHGIDMLKGEGSADCARLEAKIIAVCTSEKKGLQKKPVDHVNFKLHHGIVGDAHAGDWHRQVSLLSQTSVDKVQKNIDFKLTPGAFAENVLITSGITLFELPIGTMLKVGTAKMKVTQIGKECHFDCEIRKKAGDCVMPREGIFAEVVEEGSAKAGDTVLVIK